MLDPEKLPPVKFEGVSLLKISWIPWRICLAQKGPDFKTSFLKVADHSFGSFWV